jgi:hypothetical protein
MADTNKKLYEERLRRYVTAQYNEKPDRIPIRLFAEEFAAKYAGHTNFEVACDMNLQFDVNRECAVGLGLDAIQPNSIVNWMGMIKALGWKGITFPGIGIPVDQINQWSEPTTEEGAFLKADEYDRFTEDPTAFMMEAWLPRFTEHINEAGGPVTFKHNMSLVNGTLAFGMYILNAWAQKTQQLIEAGVVPAVSSALKAPLDILGDKLRGYVNLSMDLRLQRDKVMAACEALMPHLLATAAGGADPNGNFPVVIWMHRTCVPFISFDDFNEIHWPTLKPIVEELWSRGHQVLFYAEGNWEHHLDKFAELPEKSIIFHADKTDVFKAHRALGHKFCISGGIPNELLMFGTPDEVRARCKKVIDEVAQDGGYIMDAAALVTNDVKRENIEAMVEFTKEYGVYSQGSYRGGIEDLKKIKRAKPTTEFKTGKRKPGTCIPWEERRTEFPPITGDEALVRKTWEMIDGLGYAFCWINLTW